MGLTICPVHGQEGLRTFIEADLAEFIMEDVPLTVDDVMIISVDLVLDDDVLTFKYLVLRKSAVALNLRPHYTIRSEEDETELLGPLTQITRNGSLCGGCYVAYAKRHHFNVEW